MKILSRPFALWVSTATCCTSLSFHSKTSWRRSAFAARYTSRGHASTTATRRTTATKLRSMSTDNGEEDTSMLLRVGLCQFHVGAEKSSNLEKASEYLNRAAKEGVELAVLPEVWNSPYATAAFPEYAETLPSIGDTSSSSSESAQFLMNHAKDNQMWIVGGSVPEVAIDGNDNKEKIYNTCLVIDPSGKVVAKHRKVHLFDIDIPGGITFFESETLSPGETLSSFSMKKDKQEIVVGVGICYDIRFPEYAMLLRQKHQCSLLVYPGAFNLTTGPAHWELLQRARAVDNQCFVLTASPARTEPPETEGKYPHYTAWGHSTIVAPWGDVVATCDEKESLVVADLDLTKIDQVRKGIPISQQKRADLYELVEQQK